MLARLDGRFDRKRISYTLRIEPFVATQSSDAFTDSQQEAGEKCGLNPNVERKYLATLEETAIGLWLQNLRHWSFDIHLSLGISSLRAPRVTIAAPGGFLIPLACALPVEFHFDPELSPQNPPLIRRRKRAMPSRWTLKTASRSASFANLPLVLITSMFCSISAIN